MFGHQVFTHFSPAHALHPRQGHAPAQQVPQQRVMDHSHPMAWEAHHAALHDISGRHAGTVNPGFFSGGPAHPAQSSPLRFIRSMVDYSQTSLGPVMASQPMGNVHRALTPQGYPTGLVLIVNPWRHSQAIPREIERLAAMSEQGIAVPEILSYGQFHGYPALLMRENAPLYAAMPSNGFQGRGGY